MGHSAGEVSALRHAPSLRFREALARDQAGAPELSAWLLPSATLQTSLQTDVPEREQCPRPCTDLPMYKE